MKRRTAAILLCLALLALLLPSSPATAAERLTFVSVNDLIPPELINSITYYGGRAYAPWYVFTNYGLGVGYSFFNSAQTAYFYRDGLQLFFELKTGKTYDGNDVQYSAPAILWGGEVYVPLSLMSAMFSLGLTTLMGSEYGDIVRLTSAAVLSDDELQRAAQSFMRRYYEKYNNGVELPQPQPTETPALPETHEGERLRLSFTGLPDLSTLELLRQTGLRSCFFLTAEEVADHPDLVRRIVGEGHSLGVFCPGDIAEEFSGTAALIFEAARVVTLLLAAPGDPEAGAAWAEDAGLVWCTADLEVPESTEAASWLVSTWLEDAPVSPDLRLSCAAMDAQALERVLKLLEEQKYTVTAPRETG